MTAAPDPTHDLALVTASAEALLHDVRRLDDAALAEASALPGWRRAHVVAHLARNADGLANLLRWAATGVRQPMYPSAEAKQADLDAGTGRTAEEAALDLDQAIARFFDVASAMPPDSWQAVVHLGAAASGAAIPAGTLPWRRLVEQEVHHVDLAAGWTPAHWPAELVTRLLEELARGFLRASTLPPVRLAAVDTGWRHEASSTAPEVTGPAAALLAWLIGRSAGDGLNHDAPLPTLPAWF